MTRLRTPAINENSCKRKLRHAFFVVLLITMSTIFSHRDTNKVAPGFPMRAKKTVTRALGVTSWGPPAAQRGKYMQRPCDLAAGSKRWMFAIARLTCPYYSDSPQQIPRFLAVRPHLLSGDTVKLRTSAMNSDASSRVSAVL